MKPAHLRSRWWWRRTEPGRCRPAAERWSVWRTGTWAPSCHWRAAADSSGTPGWWSRRPSPPGARLYSCRRPAGWRGPRTLRTSTGSPRDTENTQLHHSLLIIFCLDIYFIIKINITNKYFYIFYINNVVDPCLVAIMYLSRMRLWVLRNRPGSGAV